MWYSDPFLILPAVFAQSAIIAFGVMLLMAYQRYKVATLISSVFAGAFMFIAAVSYFLGVCINHAEEINRWLGGSGIV
jgi:hypothetical protein